MLARIGILLALASAALVPAAQSAVSADQAAVPSGPTGLHAFLLRADEPRLDAFPRTPSFEWTPYERASSYDFELATSRSFDDRTVVWSTSSRTTPLRVPAVAIPVALPWMTGSPYALYAHVRAHVGSRVTRWSTPFGFNMRWKSEPEQILPDTPGLVRWKPVEGATSYEVWFVDPGKVVTTSTNVADEREYYSFHPDPLWSGTVQWRVRAVRTLYGSLPNGLPVVSYGPWSQTFVSTNPPVTNGPISLLETVSNVVGSPAKPVAHSLTPSFAFGGDTATNGISARLYRVYVATDRQCVNVVYTGAVVGSPAYAPRTSGPLTLPASTDTVTKAQSSYLADGAQAGTFSADFRAVTTTEGSAAASGAGTVAPAGGSSGATSSALPANFTASGSLVDLWDSGWPTGRYYWTVVPVREVVTETSVKYYDAEVPQDACAAGRVAEFGKASQPATTSQTRPYASGLSPNGELVAAQSSAPAFFRAALVAWAPALGATGYEVQWSKTKYPWKAAAAPVYTAATSVLLEGLTPGTWYYRVRGIDPYVPGPVKQMTWSSPVRIKLVKPSFTIQDGSVTTRRVKK
ncbi:MAG TPA: hypothetical protein VH760_08450 [Gaiellaceae bacterium]